jgi:hypothetical protein
MIASGREFLRRSFLIGYYFQSDMSRRPKCYHGHRHDVHKSDLSLACWFWFWFRVLSLCCRASWERYIHIITFDMVDVTMLILLNNSLKTNDIYIDTAFVCERERESVCVCVWVCVCVKYGFNVITYTNHPGQFCAQGSRGMEIMECNRHILCRKYCFLWKCYSHCHKYTCT